MLRILVISLFVVNLLLFGFWDKQATPQPKAPVKPKAVQDSNIPTIHLFSEMVVDQDLMSDSRQCFSLGPFHSVEDVDEVYASLIEVTVNITERQTQALVEKGYWVYLPPYKDLVEANQTLFSLQALGLQDIAVIYNGEWTNAISLGYFRRQENALKRKKSLEDRDYSPLIRVRREAEERFWLDYEKNPGSGLIALDLQNRPNDFMQRALPCPEQVASAEPVAQPVEQVASAVQEDIQQPEPEETPVVPPQDDDPLLNEATTAQLEETPDPLPLVENFELDAASTNIDDVQAVEINEAYLLPDNNTQPNGIPSQNVKEGMMTDLENVIPEEQENSGILLQEDTLPPEETEGSLPEDTDPNQDDDEDPYDGDEIKIDTV